MPAAAGFSVSFWRTAGGQRQTCRSYRVWLSEIMLQQTTVQAVGAYYASSDSMADVKALARAKEDEVLAAWRGLAITPCPNLHAAAKIVAKDLGGIFPARRRPALVAGYRQLIRRAQISPSPMTSARRRWMPMPSVVIAGSTPSKPDAKAKIECTGMQALVPERREISTGVDGFGSAICTPKRPLSELPAERILPGAQTRHPGNAAVRAPRWCGHSNAARLSWRATGGRRAFGQTPDKGC